MVAAGSPPAAAAAAVPLAPPHHLTIIDLAEIADLRHLNEGVAGVALVGVYRGQDVVVKQPKKAIIGSEEWLELQLHMKLPPHARLIPFLGICMVAQQMYFVTKWIERGSLQSLLCTAAAEGGDALRAYYSHPLHALRAAAEVAEGLEHMHRHHVVHRDVSARNILVSAQGHHIVSDLGLSRWMEKRPVSSSAATAAATAVSGAGVAGEDPSETSGTVSAAPVSVVYEDVYSMHTVTALPARWTAPECLRSQCFSEKSDVYSLGVCLWEMASGGRLPYAHVRDNLQVIAGVVLGELQLEPLASLHSSSSASSAAAASGAEQPDDVVMLFVRRCMLPVAQRPSMHQIREEMMNWIRVQEMADEQRRREQQMQDRSPPAAAEPDSPPLSESQPLPLISPPPSP